ncbi:aminodeoxychorismate/anthranilate synthase component II [Vallitaleaceae bacterium 9-2]
MFLMIDNYDSFVYNLVRYIKELNEPIEVYRNDQITIDFIYQLQPIGIILSPGPKDPMETGISHEIIQEFATKIPILGVCLGHQTIAHTYGASIIKGLRPMHGQVSSIHHNGLGVFKALPSPYQVTRYHSLVVDPDTLPADFIITARSEDGAIMGIKHKTALLEGVQFHPEAVLTEHGHQLLSNYIHWCKEVNA